MKKIASILLSVLLCTLLLAGCSFFEDETGSDPSVGDTTENEVPDGDDPTQDGEEEPDVNPSLPQLARPIPYNRDIDCQFSITTNEECPSGEIKDEFLHESVVLSEGDILFLVLDCNVKTFEWAEIPTVTVSVWFYPLTTFDVTLEEANTGDFAEQEQEGGKRIETTFAVPENKQEGRSFRIVYRLNIKTVGPLYASAEFAGANGIPAEYHLEN